MGEDNKDENPRKFKPTGKQHNEEGIKRRISQSTLSHHKSSVEKALHKITNQAHSNRKIDFSDVTSSGRVAKALSKLDGKVIGRG